MDGFIGRPQDFLGAPISVGVDEIVNEPHRKDPDPGHDLAELFDKGVSFAPVLVARTPSGRLVLLGGEGRLHAAARSGRSKIKTYVARDLQGLLAWLELDRRDAGTTRMCRSELARFSAKCQHQLSLSSRNISHLDRVLSEIHDIDPGTIRDTRQLLVRLNASPPGPEHDRTALDIDLVDRGLIRPSSAISRAVLRKKAADVLAGAKPAAEQAKTLGRAVPSLRGLVQALGDMGPVSQDVPPNVRATAEKELRAAYRELSRITKQLKQVRESTS